MRHEKNPKDSSSLVAQEGGNIPREKMFSTEHFFLDLPDLLHRYLQGWEESLPEAKGGVTGPGPGWHGQSGDYG